MEDTKKQGETKKETPAPQQNQPELMDSELDNVAGGGPGWTADDN